MSCCLSKIRRGWTPALSSKCKIFFSIQAKCGRVIFKFWEIISRYSHFVRHDESCFACQLGKSLSRSWRCGTEDAKERQSSQSDKTYDNRKYYWRTGSLSQAALRRKSASADWECLFKRSEEIAFSGRGAEKTARIVHSLRGDYRLKDILAVANLPKATYMYWQKRLDREPKDQSLQEKILEIRAEHKDFGYRSIWGLLRQTGLLINKKRVQRIV